MTTSMSLKAYGVLSETDLQAFFSLIIDILLAMTTLMSLKAHGVLSEAGLYMFSFLIVDIMLTCAGCCNVADIYLEFRAMLGVPIGALHGYRGFSDRP